MSFQHTMKIPKERIGAIIGKGGKVKSRKQADRKEVRRRNRDRQREWRR